MKLEFQLNQFFTSTIEFEWQPMKFNAITDIKN